MSSESVAPSPLWRRTMPPGPDTRMKITEGYAKAAPIHSLNQGH